MRALLGSPVGRTRGLTALVVAAVLGIAALPGQWVAAGAAANSDGCPAPTLDPGPDGDNTADAAGEGQLFERISAPPVTTDTREAGGVALVDVNRDGLIDVFEQYDREAFPTLYLNHGCFAFEEHQLTFLSEEPSGHASTPTFADFNDDGLLDFYVTRRGATGRSSLYLARGSFDTFEDVTVEMGVGNPGAYSTQASIGDVNGDGYLDIAVGADQIGSNVKLGRPIQRLYVYRPSRSGVFERGHFVDIGENGRGLIDGFSGSYLERCDRDIDRAGPGITLRDLDGDNDLDLIQSYHNDMNGGEWYDACANGEWRSGVDAWRNMLAERGRLRFRHIPEGAGGAFDDTDTSIVETGQMRYDEAAQVYKTVTRGVSLPYLNTGDVDNDGDLDVVTVGWTDPEAHVNTDMMAGKFWLNKRKWRFRAATERTGLDPLNWNYGQWTEFWDAEALPSSFVQALGCAAISQQKPKCASMTAQEHQFWGGDAVIADFNNDRWLDLLYVDRHEVETSWGTLRNVLFMNRGDGSFEPLTTEVSGIDANSVAAETADLNRDGLLDLYFPAAPGNSYIPVIRDQPGVLPDHRKQDKLYWNTGALGGDRNHWVSIRLAGRPQRRLVGSQLYLYRGAANGGRKLAKTQIRKRLIGRRDLFSSDSYKSSHDLQAHFGLGDLKRVSLRVVLPSGAIKRISCLPIDRQVVVEVRRRPTAGPC